MGVNAMPKLPDILDYNLKVIFCGTAAGDLSAQRKEYYANPTNKFWRTLSNIGLTPRRLNPSEYNSLIKYGIGLTDLAKEVSGGDSSLSSTDYNRHEFEEKIAKYKPTIIAFNGKKAAKIYFNRDSVSYGKQNQNIAKSIVFILPSTSSAAGGFWNESYWQELAAFIKNLV
jgi:TDG/mug DNA glycosylase family protein